MKILESMIDLLLMELEQNKIKLIHPQSPSSTLDQLYRKTPMSSEEC